MANEELEVSFTLHEKDDRYRIVVGSDTDGNDGLEIAVWDSATHVDNRMVFTASEARHLYEAIGAWIGWQERKRPYDLET